MLQIRYKDQVLPSNSSGVVANPTTQDLINAPIGCIMAWAKSVEEIPEGWHICDGTGGTVDLRSKFIFGASENHPAGETGGSEEVTLTEAQMPQHNHAERIGDGVVTRHNVTEVSGNYNGAFISQASITTFKGEIVNTSSKGGSQPHSNMPPYIALIFIQKISASPADYVTEERLQEALEDQSEMDKGIQIEDYDTEDGWHVRKYSDGFVEMISTDTITMALSDWLENGSAFYKDTAFAAKNYPVALTAFYGSFPSLLTNGHGYGGLVTVSAYGDNLTSTTGYAIWRFTKPNTTKSYTLKNIVIGRWK